MQQEQPISDDPMDIVKYLIRENGLDRARQIALEGTTAANQEGDFYRLSVWREVKHALSDWTEGEVEKDKDNSE